MRCFVFQFLAIIAVTALGATEVQAQTPCLDRCTKERVETCEMAMMAGAKLLSACEEEKASCDNACRKNDKSDKNDKNDKNGKKDKNDKKDDKNNDKKKDDKKNLRHN